MDKSTGTDIKSGNVLAELALKEIVAVEVTKESETKTSHTSSEDVTTERGQKTPHANATSTKRPTGNSKGVQHFTFICDNNIVEKVKAICNKERVTIRNFIEHLLLQGIASYESKHGEATATKRNAADIF